MFHAIYEHRDVWGKYYHLNAKIGGFAREDAAIKAIVRRSKGGFVTNGNGTVLFVVRNGVKIA